MPMDGANGERIDSWKDISAYLGRDVSTVIRWEKERGLPVHRIPGGQRQGVFAYRQELDKWLGGLTHTNGVTSSNGYGSNNDRSHPVSPDLKTTATAQTSSIQLRKVRVPYWKRALYTAVGSIAAVLLISAYKQVDPWFRLRAPQLIEQRQLTVNGREKIGLLTDGSTLYFGQEQDGWYGLAEMPVEGGPIRVVWNPPANVLPIAISPDAKELIASTGQGVEIERELWIVPLDGGNPRRLSNIAAHAAAWAPDGRTIAYSAGTEIYLTSEDGLATREVGSFALIPCALNWSQDGQRLRFVLAGHSGKSMLWGQLSGDGMKTATIRPLPSSTVWNGDWAPSGWADSYFVEDHVPTIERNPVWLVRYGSKWWEPPLQVAPVPFVQGALNGIAFSPKTSRLLVLTKPEDRTSFVSFDPRHQTFRQILAGVSGTFLDYSPDGKWVTYVSFPENSLWLSQADGNGARQLTFPPESVELPRWSPDGKQIAYMARQPGLPWRIYILQLETGKTREASVGNDEQGAPTWSPDGRFISYGNVECEGTSSCAIHRINLATGSVQTLPDSDGLFTARWAPNGRFIAALHLERHRLMLFDVSAGKWRMLADEIDGTDLSWSGDSKYLYTNIAGNDARIVRIRVADGHQEKVLDFRSQDSFNIAESADLQFSVARDDSLILHREIHSQEIFAYDVREH